MYFYGHKINLFCHSQFFRHLQEPSLWGKCQTQSDCKWLGRLSTNKKYEKNILCQIQKVFAWLGRLSRNENYETTNIFKA